MATTRTVLSGATYVDLGAGPLYVEIDRRSIDAGSRDGHGVRLVAAASTPAADTAAYVLIEPDTPEKAFFNYTGADNVYALRDDATVAVVAVS